MTKPITSDNVKDLEDSAGSRTKEYDIYDYIKIFNGH